MGGVKIRTTSRISSDIFNGIVKLGSGLKKKKKKGKKVLVDRQMKVFNSKSFFLFHNTGICCGFSKESLQ